MRSYDGAKNLLPKDIIKTFPENLKLKITITTNLIIVNFLYSTLDLQKRRSEELCKNLNNIPT